jgi:hypothetical protein
LQGALSLAGQDAAVSELAAGQDEGAASGLVDGQDAADLPEVPL